MAYTHLRTWSTYYAHSGTSTPKQPDAKGFVKVYYEQNQTQNKSSIKVEYWANNKYGGYEGLGVQPKVRCNNGSYGGTYQSLSKTFFAASESDVLLGTKYFDVSHNADGTCQLYVNGVYTFYIQPINGEPEFKLSDRSFSFNAALPTIPRASTITNNTSSSSTKEFGTNVTFTVSKPATSTTNTLTYQVGGTTYTIASASSETSINYAFPTSLISNFSGATPTITVTCTNSYNISSTTTVYLKYPQSFAPTVSIALQDTGQTKLTGYWVQNKSKLKGTITATPKTGASITNYSASVSDYNYTYEKTPFETNDYLTVSGNRTVTYSATDSRGLTGTGTKSIYVIPYFNPTINSAKVERCTSDGTLSDSGTYGKVTVQYQVSELKDSSNTTHNTKTLTFTDSVARATHSITLSSFSGTVSQVFDLGLVENNSYNFVFTLSDLFSPVSFNYAMGTAFKLESKKAGGKGIAFGKIATRDGMDINMDTYYKEDKVAFATIGTTTPNNAELWVKHSKNLIIGGLLNWDLNNGKILADSTRYAYIAKVKPSKTYTISRSSVGASSFYYYGKCNSFPSVGLSLSGIDLGSSSLSNTITTDNDTQYIVIFYGSGVSPQAQVENGSIKTSYEAPVQTEIKINSNGIYEEILKPRTVPYALNNATAFYYRSCYTVNGEVQISGDVRASFTSGTEVKLFTIYGYKPILDDTGSTSLRFPATNYNGLAGYCSINNKGEVYGVLNGTSSVIYINIRYAYEKDI